jgi:catechol 2,3-dioxygenase-like lactoylglutathione lyase family enzyme
MCRLLRSKDGLRSLQARPQEAAREVPVNPRANDKEEEFHMKLDMKFEVAIVPVSDVDSAKAFYTKLGWRVDDDIVNGADFRAVQLTPPNSAASITFGKGVTDAKPGSFRGGLIVSDIVAAHKQIAASGIEATEVFHGSPFSPEARISGPDPERKSYSSYVAFQDPDVNAWIVQEVAQRAPGRELPKQTAVGDDFRLPVP